MFKKILLVCSLLLGSACGSEGPLPEGVYRLYFALTETNVEGETPWPAGAIAGPSYWSVAEVRGDRWIRNRALPEGLQENRDGNKYIYCSIDWSEWPGWENTSVCLEVEDVGDGFEGQMLWDNSDGNRVYDLTATWICDNGVGVGCGDGVW